MDATSIVVNRKFKMEDLIYYIEEECYNYDISLDEEGLEYFFEKLVKKINEKRVGIVNIYLIREYIKYCINENSTEDSINYTNFVNCLNYFITCNVFTQVDIYDITKETNFNNKSFQKTYQNIS